VDKYPLGEVVAPLGLRRRLVPRRGIIGHEVRQEALVRVQLEPGHLRQSDEALSVGDVCLPIRGRGTAARPSGRFRGRTGLETGPAARSASSWRISSDFSIGKCLPASLSSAPGSDQPPPPSPPTAALYIANIESIKLTRSLASRRTTARSGRTEPFWPCSTSSSIYRASSSLVCYFTVAA